MEETFQESKHEIEMLTSVIRKQEEDLDSAHSKHMELDVLKREASSAGSESFDNSLCLN